MLLTVMLAVASGAVITRPVANMYSGPSEGRDVVSQAIYGANVGVLEDQGNWVHIRTPDEYTGWVPGSALLRNTTYAQNGTIAQVDNLYAHLYRDPDVTRRAPLLTVPFETRLEVVAQPEKPSSWLQVRLPDDRSAWIQRGDVTLDPKPLNVTETMELARRFLGLPYTWGGTSSFGYDCSGYMQMLCRRRGYSLPRDAQPQADWTGVAPVAKDQIQAGDLLYFGSSDRKITHTGMYIGNGEFINATTWNKPVIQIDKLDDPHWNSLLVACRRLR
jgi:hypothetical protein